MTRPRQFAATEHEGVRINGTTPGIRLSGTETNAEDLTIRENAGAVELYDEETGTVAGSWDLNPELENGSIAALDASLTELRVDTAANQPAAGTANRIFIETDTGTIYRDNGTSWDVMGTTNIADTDHSAADHESGGSLEVTHNNLSLNSDDHHTRPVAGILLSEDGSNNFNVDIAVDTATVSGDSTATTFTLPHSLGTTPTVAQVQPTSADAVGLFYISNKTSTDIDVIYDAAPPDGTDNLTFDLLTV